MRDDDQRLYLGDDRRRRFHADALDERRREIVQKLMQVAKIAGLLEPHHQTVAAQSEMAVDRVAHHLLRLEIALDLVFSALWIGRVVRRVDSCREFGRNQAIDGELLDRPFVEAERTSLRE